MFPPEKFIKKAIIIFVHISEKMYIKLSITKFIETLLGQFC